MNIERKYFGSPAHFIGGDDCHFHIATQIGDVCISTVGEYRPNGAPSGQSREIGLERLYETMVFPVAGPCECGCGMPRIVPREMDFAGYNSRAEANAGHEAMCVKWAAGIIEDDA